MIDFANRLSRFRERMAANGWEAVLLTAPSAVYYFTGFRSDPMERFMGLWVTDREAPVLFVPQLDEGKVAAAVGIGRKVPVKDEMSPSDVLRQAGLGTPRSCGVDKKALSWHLAEQLQSLWPEADFADVGSEIRRMMGTKTRDEADLVRQAAEIGDKALTAALASFRVGMRESELAGEIVRQIRLAGGEGLAFGPTVVSGPRTALPHADTGEELIRDGDLLVIDMGVVYRQYLSDMTRTFIVGTGNEEQERIFEIVLEANRRAVAAIKPGVPLADVDSAARDYIKAAGYGEYFTHRVGHGLGTDIHEEPSVHGGNRDCVNAGLLFTVEPGIYVPGVGGVRIEDDVYVNERGEIELLTSFPRELRRL